MGQVVAIASIAASVIGAVSAVGQGVAASRAATAQARQYEAQAKALRTQAMQAEADRRAELDSTLGTIAAIRAGRGLIRTSPTGRAIAGGITEDAMADITAERANILGQASAASQAAAASRAAGSQARISGFLTGATSLLDAGTKTYNLVKPPS
jgi:hypothetical protein